MSPGHAQVPTWQTVPAHVTRTVRVRLPPGPPQCGPTNMTVCVALDSGQSRRPGFSLAAQIRAYSSEQVAVLGNVEERPAPEAPGVPHKAEGTGGALLSAWGQVAWLEATGRWEEDTESDAAAGPACTSSSAQDWALVMPRFPLSSLPPWPGLSASGLPPVSAAFLIGQSGSHTCPPMASVWSSLPPLLALFSVPWGCHSLVPSGTKIGFQVHRWSRPAPWLLGARCQEGAQRLRFCP